MLKKHEYTFSLAQKLIDLAVVFISWVVAYYSRFHIMLPFVPEGQQGLAPIFFKVSIPVCLISLYMFHKMGLYRSYRFSSRIKEITAVLKANTLSFTIIIIALYFVSQEKISRIALLNYFLISSFLLLITRITIRNFLRHLRRKGRNLRHVFLVGDGKQIKEYIETALKFKDAGIRFSGWMDGGEIGGNFDIKKVDFTDNFEKIINRYSPDSIIIGYSGDNFHKVSRLLKDWHNDLIPLQVLPDLSYAFVGYQISDFEGIPVISINQPDISHLDFIIKRVFDFILGLIGLLIISPLLLLVAFFIKITSKGPIFYGQERTGLDGKNFTMWKFRSMKLDAESEEGAVWAKKDDPRRTPIGSFLRSTSLDELPQFWNVVKGEMSLVGPRPERPVFVEKFKNEIPAYMLRHKVKAGITGWAQVNGWRGNTSLEKRIECDIFYIKNWSLWFDVKILFLTLWKGFINKNAY